MTDGAATAEALPGRGEGPHPGSPRARARRLDGWLAASSDQRRRLPAGVTPVRSAHETVVETALLRAAEDSGPALVEATTNQVNHRGGWTELTPAAFGDRVRAAAARVGPPEDRVMLGGDHLGPGPWRNLPAGRAMEESEAMVATYASAGYEKIYLGTSMGCEGET